MRFKYICLGGGTLVHCALHCLLLLGSLHYPLLNSPLGYHPVHIHIPSLAYTMCSVCCLSIHCWVPIIVVEYYSIGCSEGDSQPSCTSREKEGKYLIVILELIHHISSVSYIQGPIQPEITVPLLHHEILENVKHLGHLRKDEDSVSVLMLLFQEFAQLSELGWVSYQTVKIHHFDWHDDWAEDLQIGFIFTSKLELSQERVSVEDLFPLVITGTGYLHVDSWGCHTWNVDLEAFVSMLFNH